MHLFTSEAVSRGHPDKICDQISDLILDYCLSINPNSRVAVETMATKNKIIIAGELYGIDINEEFEDNIISKSEKLLRIIGCRTKYNFDFYLNTQSKNIALGVDKQGAGDQGIVFGYANNETHHLMPACIYYSHLILQKIEEKIITEKLKYRLGPDAKCQVTMNYENGMPVSFHTIIVSIQHVRTITLERIEAFIKSIIKELDKNKLLTKHTKILINPTGTFIIGGTQADTGLTGRKIVVDTYGGYVAHGGGAFSGKDGTKIDRSASYMARYIAKNVVNCGIAQECIIQLAYCIGFPEPVSIYVKLIDDKQTNIQLTKLEKYIVKYINTNIDLTPKAIIRKLKLTKPIFLPTSYGGHFGRIYDPNTKYFTWEKLDLVL